MKKIGLTLGVFDLLHVGHINLINKIKKKCDYLIVGVHNDIYNIKKKNFIFSLSQRKKMIKNLKNVDKVITYTRADKIIKNIKVNYFFYGEDQNNKYFMRAKEICIKKKIRCIKINRTKNISSTKIFDKINNSNYHKRNIYK